VGNSQAAPNEGRKCPFEWPAGRRTGTRVELEFSVLECVPDAIVIVDRVGGEIVYVNRVAEELFGYERSELIGKPVEQLLPARFRNAHEEHRVEYHAQPRTRPMGIGLELFAAKKGGEEFPVEISLSPLTDGGRTYAVTAVRDVTERKAIERRASLFRRAKEELRERDAFLSIVSHELRTPVAALQLRLEMLHRAADRSSQGPLQQQYVESMGTLERLARRISLLVSGLLDVSRMRQGPLELNTEEVDLAEVARQTVDLLREEFTRAGSEVVLEPVAPVVGRWDRLRIEQVLTNLLVNAIKFGAGERIDVSVRGDVRSARLTVRDHGIGIAPEDQARVFARFERASPTDNFGGLGLGLFICRQIIEAHGGTIDVESAPGFGSTFTVELPRRAGGDVVHVDPF
jgi:two-component system, LuxR family, sensor kinase FixL